MSHSFYQFKCRRLISFASTCNSSMKIFMERHDSFFIGQLKHKLAKLSHIRRKVKFYLVKRCLKHSAKVILITKLNPLSHRFHFLVCQPRRMCYLRNFLGDMGFRQSYPLRSLKCLRHHCHSLSRMTKGNFSSCV